LLPGLPRSTGLGPVSAPALGAHTQAVQARPGPVELALAAEPVEQRVVELLPDAGALPVPQPPPAGDWAAAAKLTDRQQPPGDAGVELVDDAGQRGAVVDAGSAAIAAWWWRQERLNGLPQVVGDEGLDGHGGGSCSTSRASSKIRSKVGNTL
jgi:hypothetical protein